MKYNNQSSRASLGNIFNLLIVCLAQVQLDILVRAVFCNKTDHFEMIIDLPIIINWLRYSGICMSRIQYWLRILLI